MNIRYGALVLIAALAACSSKPVAPIDAAALNLSVHDAAVYVCNQDHLSPTNVQMRAHTADLDPYTAKAVESANATSIQNNGPTIVPYDVYCGVVEQDDDELYSPADLQKADTAGGVSKYFDQEAQSACDFDTHMIKGAHGNDHFWAWKDAWEDGQTQRAESYCYYGTVASRLVLAPKAQQQ